MLRNLILVLLLLQVQAQEKASSYIDEKALAHVLSMTNTESEDSNLSSTTNGSQEERDLLRIFHNRNNNDNNENDNNIDSNVGGSMGDRCGSGGRVVNRLVGGNNGGNNDNNTCKAGLDCDRVGVGMRCIPPRECLRAGLHDFHYNFDPEQYKQEVFQRSGVTFDDLYQARLRLPDDREFVHSQEMQAVIKTMQENPGNLGLIGETFRKCTSLVEDENDTSTTQDVPMMDYPVQQQYDDPTTTTYNNHEHPYTRARYLQGTPTPAPTTAAPVLGPNNLFLGLHIEFGGGVDASISVFWQDGDTSLRTWVRGCLGAEIGAGAEFSFIALFSQSSDVMDIGCGSVLFDTDIGVGIAAGVGLGVCFNRNPGSLYFEVTIGAGTGGGFGAAACAILPENVTPGIPGT